MNDAGIRWSAKTEYYDIENGEQLTKWNAKQNYIKIKTRKHATINEIRTKGNITFTIECRRNPQTKLFTTS